MKENLDKVLNKVKELWGKAKEELKKFDVVNKVVALARANRLVCSIVFFIVAILSLILIATLGWGEFVVPVCALMILEVAMSVINHRTEIWIHGILLGLHLVVGILINRFPMMFLCMMAYIITTLTQQVAFKKVVTEPEKKEEDEPKRTESKKINKKKKQKEKENE